ncbi:hypothetical protein L7F22_009141 [Adiantum nelumboides]|nr:hypothetical protein [Adiantum nelumboides]
MACFLLPLRGLIFASFLAVGFTSMKESAEKLSKITVSRLLCLTPVATELLVYDGTNVGPNKYVLNTTIANLKESILSQWPKDNERNPKTINDLRLINVGKILENNKTLADLEYLWVRYLAQLL